MSLSINQSVVPILKIKVSIDHLSMHTRASLFSKWRYVLLSNLVKCQSHKIGCYNDCVVLKFDRHVDSAAAEVHVKFQSDWKS